MYSRLTIFMKYKITSFFLLGIIFLLFSCNAENDEYGLAIPIESVVNFFPLSEGNQWTYENHRQFNGFIEENEEVLTVTDSVPVFETPSYYFSSDQPISDQGVATKMLSQGYLNKVEGKLIYNGNYIFDFPLLGDSIVIPLENALLIHQSRNPGQVIFSQEGSFLQSIYLQNTEVPLYFTYSLKIIQGSKSENFSSIFNEYEEVISSQIVLDLQAEYNPSSNQPVEVLNQTDASVTTFYFARNIGLFNVYQTAHLPYKNLHQLGLTNLDPIQGWSSQDLKSIRLK